MTTPQDELRAALAHLTKGKQKRPAFGGQRTHKFNASAGWRILGGKKYYFRSKREANFARYLQWQLDRGDILEWKYEKEKFLFEKIVTGQRLYIVDFTVLDKDNNTIRYEVKGWLDQRSKTKLNRMKKFFPECPITFRGNDWFKLNEPNLRTVIPNWE